MADTQIIHEIQQIRRRMLLNSITIKEIITFLNTATFVRISDEKQFLLIEYLEKWKINQHLAMYGDRTFVQNDNLVFCKDEQDYKNAQKMQLDKLNEIQTVFDGLVSIIWESSRFIRNSADREEIIKILTFLVKRSLIVVDQPPSVYKAQKKFNTKARLLLSSKFVQTEQLNSPDVFLVSEKGKCGGMKVGKEKGYTAWVQQQISNGMGENITQFTYHMENVLIQRTDVKRGETRDEARVMDEKFAIQFQLNLQIIGYTIPVSTTSSPFVFIVSGKQLAQSWATIIWDSAFFSAHRTPFDFDESIEWPQMADNLCKWFAGQTGCALTEENLNSLRQKVFQNNTSPVLTWKLFAKDSFGTGFSFGKWFYEAMRLTRNFLSGEWKAGLIVGFIDKIEAKEKLQQPGISVGTFLLRFSESTCGCISVAYVKKDGEVDNLQPFFHKNFENPVHPMDSSSREKKPHTIGHLIKHLSCLTHLYSNRPEILDKTHAFGNFYTKISERDNKGYKTVTQTTVEATGNARVGNGYKQTEKSMVLDTSPGSEATTSTANASPNCPPQSQWAIDETQNLPGVSSTSKDDFSLDDIDMEGAVALVEVTDVVDFEVLDFDLNRLS